MNINYTTSPKAFANTAFIDYSYFEMLYDLLNYSIQPKPETIIGLSVLAEAVVLHEELIPSNHNLSCESENEEDFIRDFVNSSVFYFENGRGFYPLPNSAVRIFYDELSDFRENLFGDVGMSTKEIGVLDTDGFSPIANDLQLTVYQTGWDDPETFDNTIAYNKEKNFIASSHGIPIIDGIYDMYMGEETYFFDDLARNLNTTIPKNLLNTIDKKRFAYIDPLRKYLGNTYVGLPSIISIILTRAKDIHDIPNQMLLLREELTEFRNTCTKFEYDLRTEDSFSHKCQLIDELKNAHDLLAFDGVKKKRRILKQTAEIASPNPVSTAINVASKAIDLSEEIKINLKIPGYYDLYKKSFDVQDNLRALQKLFGSQIDTAFLNNLSHLQQTEQN